jgi:hypothetical protein
MTAQSLYNSFLKNEITENKFLYEVRKDERLPMITKFNSFKDTIQILKNKSIISEEMGRYNTDKNVFFPKQEIKTIDQVSPHEYAKGINYEMELFDKSVGQNMPTDEELEKSQQKVLRNLSKDEYYYTRKIMTSGQKKQENQDLEYTELGKETKAKNQMVKGKMLKENLESSVKTFNNAIKKGNISKRDGDKMIKVKDFDINLFISSNPIFKGKEEEIKKIIGSLKENLDQHYSQDGDEDCESCDRDLPELDMDVMDQNELEKLSKIIEEWGLTEYDLNDEDVIEELAAEFQKREGNDLEEGIALKDKAGNITYAKDEAEATLKMNDARTKNIQLTKQNV